MDKLYEIWYVGYTSYPMLKTITVTNYQRNQLISTNRDKLQDECDYLNHICDADEYYEIREVNTNERV
ncbi:hypothetical protein C4577_07455 [Candidatus Parcubacteria bacterium]|nr:MAG: hypothetical protein C4577_07455 [Candidatus Parcubacteria bacterium]